MKFTDTFNPQRFVRVLLNDLLLLQARRILFASLGLTFIGLISYATSATTSPDDNMEVAAVLFGILLIGGGQIFTSMIYNDMHHPLERFQYLMLPCSNLERFVSRYLITGPFYVLYAIVFYLVFEVVANTTTSILWDVTIPRLDLGSDAVRGIILVYFISHIFVYAAAIWFRSFALIKLMAASFLFWTACGIVSFAALRLFYFDSFISMFEMNPDGPIPNIRLEWLALNDDDTLKLHQEIAFTLGFLWIMFLAYLGLREHEVQDGL